MFNLESKQMRLENESFKMNLNMKKEAGRTDVCIELIFQGEINLTYCSGFRPKVTGADNPTRIFLRPIDIKYIRSLHEALRKSVDNVDFRYSATYVNNEGELVALNKKDMTNLSNVLKVDYINPLPVNLKKSSERSRRIARKCH